MINTINFPQQFRMQADIGATWHKLRTRLTLNHLGGYSNTGVIPYQTVASYNSVDAYVGVDVTERFNLSIDARNLFNQNPPFVDQTRGYDAQSANPMPRVISLTAGVKF